MPSEVCHGAPRLFLMYAAARLPQQMQLARPRFVWMSCSHTPSVDKCMGYMSDTAASLKDAIAGVSWGSMAAPHACSCCGHSANNS